MKLSIRFADQIVGAFIILALGILIFVIFMLGSSQRWFAKDYLYKTYLNSGGGVSQNMPVQYKGFTIGRVKSIKLSGDDRVEVSFTIFDIYNDRVKEGSMVEVLESPIGLGNQFLFYPGLGTEQIPEEGVIPVVNSPEARRLIAAGLAVLPERDDGINNIMNRVNSVLATLDTTLVDIDTTLVDIQEAVKGTNGTSLGRTLGNVESATSGLSNMSRTLPADITRTLDQVKDTLDQVVVDLDPILNNLQDFTDKLSDPSGSVMSILDSEGPLYTDLIASLDSISGTLRNLERTSRFLPSQFTSVLSSVHGTLQSAQDVLIALTNNPLLKKGVPVHTETYPGGARPRDLEF